MSSEHEDHGNTPAAWTAVAIIIVGFTIGGFGMIVANVPLFVVGGIICVVGVVVGKVMQMMGMGAVPAGADDNSASAERPAA